MLIFEVVTWVLAGVLVGAAARRAFPLQTRDREPVMTAMIGAALGGGLGALTVGERAGTYRALPLIFAAVGAVLALLALWVYWGAQRPRHGDA